MRRNIRRYNTRQPPDQQTSNPDQILGVILHQPLNLSNFRKNSDFSENMNGIPVCLARKMENAPTWRPRNPDF